MLDIRANPTVQKLLTAFRQFGKAQWHSRTIAGFKPSEIRVLFCIKYGHKPEHGMHPEHETHTRKVSEISRQLQVTSPTITQLLKNLEANGLVERHLDPTDRRAVEIGLTEKGEEVVQQAAYAYSASIQGLIEYMGEDECNQLADLLLKASRYYTERASSADFSSWNGDEQA